MGLPRKAKKGIPGTLGRRAWKRLFRLISKGFGFVRLSMPPWGSAHQNKYDEDLFLCFLFPEIHVKVPYEALRAP